MAHRYPHIGADQVPLAMAGFGRGQAINISDTAAQLASADGRPGSSTETHNLTTNGANRWAASVLNSGLAQARWTGLSNDTIDSLVLELEAIWSDESRKDKKKKCQAVGRKVFESVCASRNPWDSVLCLITTIPDYKEAKAASLAFTVLVEFEKWVSSPENTFSQAEEEKCMGKDLKLQAFSAFSGRHLTFFVMASRAFHLNHPGNEYFLTFIRPLLAQNKVVEASTMVGSLGLQDHFSIEEIVVPLLLSDKINLLESYVAGSTGQQTALLALLDHLCARSTDILSFAQNANVKGVKGQKLSKKIISKLAVRLMKVYSIPPETCPNITENRAMSAIRYLLYKRYVEKSLGAGSWDDMVESSVGDNRSLQQQLVQELLAFNDLNEAARWAILYRLVDSELDPSVAAQCKRLREAKHTPDKVGQPSQASQNCGGDEDWDQEVSTSHTSHNSQYYSIPLARSQIVVVDTPSKLRACLHRLSQPETTIGIDAEWKPTMGAGMVERVALLQLAVEESVFLLDLVELGKVLTDSDWVHMAESVFCIKSVLKIGFGLDHDLRMLVKTAACLEEPLMRMERVMDLEKLATKVMETNQDAQPEDNVGSLDQHTDGRSKPGRSTQFQKSEEKGLSLLVKTLLGKPLSKAEQMSNWERRPLRDTQKIYAASDAYVLLDLYKVLVSRGKAMGLSKQDLEPQTVLKVKSRMDKKKERASNLGKKRTEACQVSPTVSAQPAPVQPCIITERRRPSQLRVVCNNMLQGLGSQLRTCGVDTVIMGPNSRHTDAVQISRREKRFVLSSGKVFDQVRAGVGASMCLNVPHNISSRDQCIFVLRQFGVCVQKEDIFSRCCVCNSAEFVHLPSHDLETLSIFALQQGGARGGASMYDVDHDTRVKFLNYGIDPAHITFLHNRVRVQVETVPNRTVFKKVSVFFVCTSCGKVYWEGSHWENISKQFTDILTLGASPTSQCDATGSTSSTSEGASIDAFRSEYGSSNRMTLDPHRYNGSNNHVSGKVVRSLRGNVRPTDSRINNKVYHKSTAGNGPGREYNNAWYNTQSSTVDQLGNCNNSRVVVVDDKCTVDNVSSGTLFVANEDSDNDEDLAFHGSEYSSYHRGYDCAF